MASAKEIPPGGEGSISVTFTTKNRSGKNVKHVKVASNDPRQPMVSLEVKADLEPLVAFDPPYANFGTVAPKAGATQRIRLIGRDAAKTKILGVAPTGRGNAPQPPEVPLEVRLVEADDGTGQVVEVSIEPGAEPTLLRGSYDVKTDHPEVPMLRLRVAGKIRGPVDWRPERVYFADLEPGHPQQRAVIVSGRYDVTDATVEHPSLSVEIQKRDNGSSKVVVTCTGDVEKNADTTALRIRTSHPEHPVIEVPVTLVKKRERPSPH